MRSYTTFIIGLREVFLRLLRYSCLSNKPTKSKVRVLTRFKSSKISEAPITFLKEFSLESLLCLLIL